MKLQPVQRYPRPHLPTREIVDKHPEILRLLPKRWQSNPAVIAALTACLSLSSCARAADKTPSRVAPVFVHGDGVGSFGCRIINPPVFLSEDEAQQVILTEAKRAGIAFAKGGKKLDHVETPVTSLWRSGRGKTRLRAVNLDGVDRKRGIAFKYVSAKAYASWRPASDSGPTVYGYDMIGAAKQLQRGIRRARPAGTYGVFYDPLVGAEQYEKDMGHPIDYRKLQTNWQAERAKIQAAEKEIAREQLRRQVKDFIKWLKAQGVI